MILFAHLYLYIYIPHIDIHTPHTGLFTGGLIQGVIQRVTREILLLRKMIDDMLSRLSRVIRVIAIRPRFRRVIMVIRVILVIRVI